MTITEHTYLETHPWITFRVDTRKLPAFVWTLLGVCASECDQIANSMLKPTFGKQLLTVFLAKGAHATTAIEGNTLQEADAVKAVEGQLHLPESQEYLGQEVSNVIEAANEIKNSLIRKDSSAHLTPELIAHYNLVVLKDLPLGEDVVPGAMRSHSVGVARYRGAPAEDCEYLVARLCEWLNTFELNSDDPELRVPYAVIKAILAHLYLAWIHPFGDGNGRTARLMELQILLAAELPTPAGQLLSNHYNQTRSEYYRQLDQASKTGDPLPFLVYAIRGLVDGLRDAVRLIHTQQFADRWEQFVYETFGELKSEADRRRLRLVLDLSKDWAQRGVPVPKRDLPRLSPGLTEAYASKTGKTLTRDLNAVRALGLVDAVSAGYQPRDWVILTFRPERRSESP